MHTVSWHYQGRHAHLHFPKPPHGSDSEACLVWMTRAGKLRQCSTHRLLQQHMTAGGGVELGPEEQLPRGGRIRARVCGLVWLSFRRLHGREARNETRMACRCKDSNAQAKMETPKECNLVRAL